ncbi:hypothetical protein FC756_16235 [Lysinibacillus mangiferihumi]|uniref:DUF2187 domain-containing protein n=1 Tax=Lysinibacillus mangiferihumi TaxID=1130819 RepID=A0A4U2YVK2_9BACI|nr:hypothetical protein [Lysinibacillus mangiferihumi]TKI65597.1 hypothetical protein FC756_16235 [Lysinibacillus mangiferihumi]
MSKFKTGDKVIVSSLTEDIRLNGKVYNYNDFREPGMEYGVVLDAPYDAVVFVGESQLEKNEEAI